MNSWYFTRLTLFSFFFGLVLTAAAVSAPAAMTQEKKLVAFVDQSAEAYLSQAVTAEAEKRLLTVFSKPKGPWVEGEFYIYVYDLKGICLAHGYKKELIGMNLINLKDTDGVFMIQEILNGLKTSDRYWQNFRFPNPVNSNKVSPKRSYNRLVASRFHPGGLMIGSGYYITE